MEAAPERDQPVREFVEVARRFCQQVESGCIDVAVLRLTLADLHAVVLRLPEAEPDLDREEHKITIEDYQNIVGRLKDVPFDYYWDVFDPWTLKTNKPSATRSVTTLLTSGAI